MAKTPISARNSAERGAALLEAVIALGLVAMIAAAGYAAFSRAADSAARAEARLTALAAAESALERASAPDFLAEALTAGDAALQGPGWRVTGAPYAAEGGLIALVALTATAGPDPEAPLVTLTTIRGTPR